MIRNEDGLLTEYVFVDVTDVPLVIMSNKHNANCKTS